MYNTIMRYPSTIAILLLASSFVSAQDFLPGQKDHWAWKKPVRHAPPTVKNQAWVRNPIDAFILAELEKADLKPAPQATREHLLRRVTFDLVGLPPTPQEMDAFLADQTPEAWGKVVDRLLASPHYGERWGRHWLDLARYAESNGFEFDELRPDAWRYRDYVIASFNQDKPYDRFLKEQLAGDELWPDDPQARIATGFNLLGPDMTDNASQAQRRQNTLDDMTDTTGLVFLGLTLGCARCHDHKFEPLFQTDFYRMQAFFAPSQFRKDVPISDAKALQEQKDAAARYQKAIAPVQEQIMALEGPYRDKLKAARLARLSEVGKDTIKIPIDKLTPAQKDIFDKAQRLLTVPATEVQNALSEADKARFKKLEAELKGFDAIKPKALPVALGLSDGPKVPKTFLLERGELKNPGDEVQPGYPVVLSPDFKEGPAKIAAKPGATGRRSALANWLADPAHPLTARVLVNRLWQHHFGRGIVATASDFGIRGEAPTHPELLDWLATEFTAQGWSIKKMHRLMLTSAAYQMSTETSSQTKEKDPANEYFSRMSRHRLEGEIVRDTLLSVAGKLNAKLGGPSVFPPLPSDVVGVKDWKVSPDPDEHRRRSVYVFVRRNLRFAFLESFDLPDTNQSCPKRERSTTAPQALTLLNASDVVSAAKSLAGRVSKEASTEPERVELAFRLALGRRPTEQESRVSHDFLKGSPLFELCRALFNTNEFIYLD